jgi:hypothetical protein
MWEYKRGNCKDCNNIIHIDEPYRHVGKTLFDGIICENCITVRDLRKIKDYIDGCEDDDGYIFDNHAESLLYDAYNIIQQLQGKLDVLEELYDYDMELNKDHVQSLKRALKDIADINIYNLDKSKYFLTLQDMQNMAETMLEDTDY